MANVNYNKLILGGNLTRDVEIRVTQSGMSVGKFGLAVNRKMIKDGEKKESTCFVDCSVFGKTADAIAKYFKKGSGIFVEGRLEFSTWEAKDGSGKRSKHEMIVENFQFTDTNNGGSSQTSSQPKQASSDDDYNDIPF